MNKIIEGITNTLFKRSDVEKISSSRYAICLECPHIDHEGGSCVVPFSQPCCSICGCVLKLKTRSLSSSCPKGYWEAKLSEREEDKLNKRLGLY